MGLCRRAGGRPADPALLAGLSADAGERRFRQAGRGCRACRRTPKSCASAAQARARPMRLRHSPRPASPIAGMWRKVLKATVTGKAIAVQSAAGRRPGFPGSKADEERRQIILARALGREYQAGAGRCSTARLMARPRKRCSSIRASSMTSRRPPRSASPARMTAMSMAATAIRPSPCSRKGCGCSKEPKPAMALASGMASVFGALACQLKAGDHLVSSKALFGSCYQVITNILPRFGIRSTLVDGIGYRCLEKRHHQGHEMRVPGNAIQSDTRCDRPRRRRATSPKRRVARRSWSTMSSRPRSCRSR